MSTPTPSHPPQPGSASKKATAAHATTPSHLGLSSPAPRSVPSPAATRKDHAGKTPRDHGTVSSHGSKTVGGTPMVQNLSQTGVGSSPGAAMAYFGTPLNGLGVDLGGITPGQLNMPTPLVSAVAMMPSLSGLSGIDLGGVTKRNEDEERRAKMRKVLNTIGRPKGRVSEESIARISRRLGLQNDIDQEKLSPEERQRKVGNRTIGIAGKTILIDLELKNHVAQNVSVMFSGESKTLEQQGVAAGKILLGDLAMKNGSLLQTPLDAFTAHLSDLARIDRLSDKIGCFDALSGIYNSLNRVYDLEKEAVRSRLEDNPRTSKTKTSVDRDAELEVMRQHSGRPFIHERGRLGVSVEYWTSTPYLYKPPAEIEEQQKNAAKEPIRPDDSDDVYSLRIDVENSPVGLFPPIRVSDAWLPENFDLPSINGNVPLPWQDPPPTFVTSGEVPSIDSMDLGDSHRLPELRFVAKLSPPIVIPLPVAAEIFTALGSTQSAFPYATYQAMLLGLPPHGDVGSQIEASMNVLSSRDGAEVDVKHHYSLDTPKSDYGFKLEQFPFAHPRQVVELLPVLRQWACFGSLLRGSLKSPFAEPQVTENPQAPNGEADTADPSSIVVSPDWRAQEGPVEGLDVNLSMSTSPQPGLSIMMVSHEAVLQTDLHISLNGGIIVVDQLGDVTESSVEGTDLATKLSRALAACGDLGVWIEWMRKLLPQQKMTIPLRPL